jgi:alkylhydroperoxidase/carboxymuconolactone decarboxylase family protein YurZ
MRSYQSPDDLEYADSLIRFAPKEAAAFFNLKHTAEREDGVIPAKYRELMSVAVALTTQCAYWPKPNEDTGGEFPWEVDRAESG